MSNFKDFTRAIAGIASALKGINTVVDDIPVPGSGGGSSINYKIDEEHEIGVWTDGTTPLYEKVLWDAGVTQGTDHYIDIDESVIDLKNAWVHEAVFFGPARNRASWKSGSSDLGEVVLFNSTESNQIYYKVNGLGDGTVNCMFVLRYTKVVS